MEAMEEVNPAAWSRERRRKGLSGRARDLDLGIGTWRSGSPRGNLSSNCHKAISERCNVGWQVGRRILEELPASSGWWWWYSPPVPVYQRDEDRGGMTLGCQIDGVDHYPREGWSVTALISAQHDMQPAEGQSSSRHLASGPPD